MGALSLDTLKTLAEVNARINSSYSDTGALLVYILESVMRLIECEASSVLLANTSDGLFHFAASRGFDESVVKDLVIEKQSITGWIVENNVPVILNRPENNSRFANRIEEKTGVKTRTLIAVPMRVKNICVGVIELLNKTSSREFDKDDLEILKMFSDQAGIAYQNAGEYRNAQEHIALMRKNLSFSSDYHTFIAKSSVILDLIHVIEEVASTNSSVLITGESGVGKELFAEQLHLKSPRNGKPFIRVNCAALSPALLESELFGHVKGAYTDAVSNQKGRFEMADGGTLFLDEIGELPLDLQSKLLRVIQSRQFERVGSSETISVDVRIIAATHRDLEAMVKAGTFRSDLYYRLNVLPLNVPPLRQRKEDIDPLAKFFLNKFSAETKKNFEGFSESAREALYNYYWPGNIRELENTIERACVLGHPPFIQVSDLRIPTSDEPVKQQDSMTTECIADSMDGSDRTLKTALTKFKKAYVMKILQQTNGNQTETAKILDVQRTYVSRLINELDIRRTK